jgi:hypothetical protein
MLAPALPPDAVANGSTTNPEAETRRPFRQYSDREWRASRLNRRQGIVPLARIGARRLGGAALSAAAAGSYVRAQNSACAAFRSGAQTARRKGLIGRLEIRQDRFTLGPFVGRQFWFGHRLPYNRGPIVYHAAIRIIAHKIIYIGAATTLRNEFDGHDFPLMIVPNVPSMAA